jgi:hypothetical protein
MRVFEFLIQLLHAQGLTLKRLAALVGEDILIELLEMAGDSQLEIEKELIEIPIAPPKPGVSESSAYAALQAAVSDMKLPSQLEFHLWAYPTYRSFIESSLDLTAMIELVGEDAPFVDQAMDQAGEWIKKLPLPPDLGHQAEAAAKVSWKRFRAAVLQKLGRKPLLRVR